MKMKPYHSILIFAAFIISAIVTSVGSYHRTQRDIVCDMDQALYITLQERQDQWITPDTIQDYRSHLRIDLLKESSLLCYVVDDRHNSSQLLPKKQRGKQLESKAMQLNSHTIRGYANCSMADIWGMSDQRTPLSLVLMAVLWATGAVLYHKRRAQEGGAMLAVVACAEHATAVDRECHVQRFGSLSYSVSDDYYYNNETQQTVRFTPMQHRLMQMFFDNAQHQLSKQDICETLWPKKPDASETLYTLIRRIKPIVESNGLRIESERGRAYRLVEVK